MMHFILFILYFFVLCFIINRLHFFKGVFRSGVMPGLFTLHVAVGCLHNWIAYRYFPGHGDIWFFFKEGTRLREIFLQHPASFFTYNSAAFNIADTHQPILDFQYQFFQRFNVILNLFSFDNIYINTLIFSLPVFAGTIALFKAFYKNYQRPLPSICTVLLPSVLFWTSVVYKDGLFYMAVGYFIYFLLARNAMAWRKTVWIIFCLALMCISRANALVTFLPALLFCLLMHKLRSGKSAILITLVALTAIIFIVNILLPTGILTAVSDRQKEFHSLEGGSRLVLPLLEPSLQSFLHVLPAALINGLFQPFPGAGGKLIYLAFSAELIAYWVLIIIAGLLLIRKKAVLNNFDLASLMFAIPGMIIIGCIVPFAGAIIRYRSIYLPFLFAPFVNMLCNHAGSALSSADIWLRRNIMIAAQ